MTESDSIPAGTAFGQPAEDPPAPPGPAFKDRKIGLILFGIVQLLMALVCLAFTALQLVMLFGSEALRVDAGLYGADMGEVMGSRGLLVFTAFFYLLVAGGIAWLGIGSIRCRRWARAVTLVLASIGLVVGVMSTFFVMSLFHSMLTEMSSQAGGGDAPVMVGLGCAFVGIAFLYVLLPGAFVLFYRSPHVEATCEHYDARERWTDRLPLPVLAGWILLLPAAGAVFTPLIGTPMPFFGALLTGPPAWLYAFAMAGLAAYLARGFFRLESWAWFGALLFMTFNGVSAYLSFRGDGLLRMYEEMGTPPERLEILESMGMMTSMPWMVLASTVVALGFYLWLGRYFGGDRTA